MSAIQPIPAVTAVFGDTIPIVDAAFRPARNGHGRRTGWMRANHVIRVSKTTLRMLRDEGYTRIRLDDHVFDIEELLNA